MNVASRIEERRPLPLTVEDFRILANAGAFVGRPKVELIQGVIVTASPQKNLHSFLKSELALRLGLRLRELRSPMRAITEGTLDLSPDSAPDPDITITSDAPTDSFILRETVALIVEISDTSLTYDLETKAALYARSGVPEYWVVAARKRQVHRHWTPEQDGYRDKDVISFGDLLESATMPDLAVDTEGLV
jgi:Uma2 family endonuclease